MKRQKMTAVLLSFFMGGMGFHKFYLGKVGVGIAYFLFFWTFIPSILALIDFFSLLGISEQEFDKRYNYELVSSKKRK